MILYILQHIFLHISEDINQLPLQVEEEEKKINGRETIRSSTAIL